eukprot:gnl/Spiro4/11764_TR6210_c0_g1_i1.p1 gnl/Spiro4/11764_TR6210_c0_g1~~gnl/Spiro4/11764_TR6210_c0_g1_i1.p1  ORF type:complete len:151 (-),score=46.43 gnl/Spiro4/11764_TR6210_c0_g1_i1:91-495(-)
MVFRLGIECETTLIGFLLSTLGVCTYIHTGMVSKTALIPLFLGAPLAVTGMMLLILPDTPKKIVAHLMVLSTLLLGLAVGVMGVQTYLTKGLTTSAGEQLAMAVLCALHVFCCVRHFMENREKKRLLDKATSRP